MINYREQHTQISFWINPKCIAHHFHKRLEKYADWQVLLEYEWGDVGYDYEEGIRLVTLPTPEAVNAAVRWAEGMLRELGVNPAAPQKHWWLDAGLSQHSRDGHEEQDLFGVLGWKHYEESWRGWYWDYANCSIINCTSSPNQEPLVGGPKVDENTYTANAGTVNDPPAAAAPATPSPETQPTTATSKPRSKSVKGAMKLARDMKDAGKTREEIAKAVVDLYVAGGRTEKDAKYFASGTLWSVFGATKPRKAAETPAAAPTTPQTNA